MSKTLSQKELAQYEKEYRAIYGSLEVFARVFCEAMLYEDVPEFHREIYGLLPVAERLVLAAPRGFAKSTICSVIYPLWLALTEQRKDICLISASEGLAIDMLRRIKTEMEGNAGILAYFGDVKSSKWTESHIILNNESRVNIRAKGAGGQIRGFRPDCIILDDIETDESVQSDDQRIKLKNWLNQACINTLLPRGQMVLIGTIIHPLSVLSDLLDAPNNWEKRKYTAYVDGIEAEGHELWATARPHGWLQGRKAEIGSWAFSAEFMNDPKTDETAPIKTEQIRYWEQLPKQYSCVIAVDPAYSEDSTADYKTAALIGVNENSDRYLIDYIRTHSPQGEYMDAVINMFLRNKGLVTGLGVPNVGTEKSFFASFMQRCDERKVYPPIVELKNVYSNAKTGVTKRNKRDRIVAALQPLFENGKYYIHANHIEAKEELLTIGSSKHDDVVDCMSYAEQILQPHVQFDSGFDDARLGGAAAPVGYVANYGV